MSCVLFRLPNVGQGYNDIILFVVCNSLSANLPSDLCPSREDLHGPPPCITRTNYNLTNVMRTIGMNVYVDVHGE